MLEQALYNNYMKSNKPYALLGETLRRYRESSSKSVDDLAAVMELKVSEITELEAGNLKPTENVIEMFSNHFRLSDMEEDMLWEQAGYPEPEMYQEGFCPGHDNEFESCHDSANMHNIPGMPMSGELGVTHIVVPLESRVLYTDMAHVMTSSNGVIVNFIQNNVANLPPIVVSRLGMSKEHAKQLISVLTEGLEKLDEQSKPKKQKTQQKLLPGAEDAK
jgi:Helix-turn-helix domain/Protein of unknown function (DUF3467)